MVDYTPDYTEDVGNYIPDYDDNIGNDYDDDIGNEVPGDITCAGLNSWTTHGHHYGILDGGATSTCGSFELIQLIADAWEPLDRYPTLGNSGGRDFTFAGGEKSSSKVRAWMPNEVFADGIAANVVPCTSTPILIGIDMLSYYGLVLDYAHNTVYSHRLKRKIPCTVLKSGHLGLLMTPENGKY